MLSQLCVQPKAKHRALASLAPSSGAVERHSPGNSVQNTQLQTELSPRSVFASKPLGQFNLGDGARHGQPCPGQASWAARAEPWHAAAANAAGQSQEQLPTAKGSQLCVFSSFNSSFQTQNSSSHTPTVLFLGGRAVSCLSKSPSVAGARHTRGSCRSVF